MERCSQDQMLDLGTTIIKVRVGKEENDQVDIPVYENLIRQSSEFFKAALLSLTSQSDTQESVHDQERVIHLPDRFSPKIFTIYIQWLLTGRLHSKVGASISLFVEEQKEFSPTILELLTFGGASILAHYLEDTNFTDTVSDAILQWCVEATPDDLPFIILCGSKIYDEISPDSRVRQLLADIIAWTADDQGMAALVDEGGHEELVARVMMALAERFLSRAEKRSPLEGWEGSCRYHTHGEEKRCYRDSARGYVPSYSNPSFSTS